MIMKNLFMIPKDYTIDSNKSKIFCMIRKKVKK